MLRRYLTIPRLEEIPWLVHGFGTAAWKEEDFASSESLASFRVVLLKQVHSDVVRAVEAPPVERLSGDALVTRTAGLLLVVKTADCLPVLLVDPEHRAVAAVHCGWRGTGMGILKKAVAALREAGGGQDSRKFLAAMGPCIGPSCYEVGADVVDVFSRSGFPPSVFNEVPERPGKFLLDLQSANRRILAAEGIPPENIFSIEACTHCGPEYYSYRRDNDKTRRMFAFVGIKAI